MPTRRYRGEPHPIHRGSTVPPPDGTVDPRDLILNTSEAAYSEDLSSYNYSQPESLAAPEFEESLDPYPNSSLPTTTASFYPYLQTPASFETSYDVTTTSTEFSSQQHLSATVTPITGYASEL